MYDRSCLSTYLPAAALGLLGLAATAGMQLRPSAGEPVLVLLPPAALEHGAGAALAAGWRLQRIGQAGRVGYLIATPDDNSDTAMLRQVTAGWVVVSARGSFACAPRLQEEG